MYAVNVTSPVQLPLVSGCRNSGDSTAIHSNAAQCTVNPEAHTERYSVVHYILRSVAHCRVVQCSAVRCSVV